MVNDIAVQDFVNAIKEEPQDTNKTYNATVSHIDNEGVVWVYLQGSSKETPTASTSTEVKKGDNVTVQWRNNKLYIGGNYSNPSVGVTTVMPSVDFVAELADKDVTVNSITATTGYIKDLTSENITTENIIATNGYIKELTADNIKAEDIVADHATVGNLDANYAKINAANITDLSAQNAWVNKIMVQTGLLAHEGTVFTLDAIQVNAANITAGTIDVNRLIVTVDGEKYLVEIDPTTHQPSYEKLDGGIVEPRTITADKIVAHDITVQEITTENLVGTNGWINLNQGKFFYTTNGSTWANTTNGIMWDGTSLKIKGDVNITAGNVYTKTQTDTALGGKVGNNEVITKINASSEGVQIQAAKVDIAGAAVFNDYSTTQQMNEAIGNAVDDIDIGGRNLFGYLSQCETLNGITVIGDWNTVTEDGYKCAHVSGTFNKTNYIQSKIPYLPAPNETITFSGFVKIKNIVDGTTNPMCEFYFGGETIDGRWMAPDINAIYLDGKKVQLSNPVNRFPTYISDTKWHHFAIVKTWPNCNFTANQSPWVYLRDCTGDLYVRHIKYERGNKATDWTPAPEDIKAIHVLDSAYLSTGQPFETILGWCEWAEARFDINTTSTPLTGVKIGDTARIRYLANNVGNNGTEVYLVGSVSVVGADYIKAKSLSLESTVVDGGHILTGTIDTNRLNANTIKSQIVQTTELNADKITSGKVKATYIDTDHITIGQGQVTNLSTDLNNIRAQYGYTNTAADTATKVVVLPDYVDRQGAIIAVRFRDGNTVNPISLNVNNTGVKVVQTVDPINDLPAATTANFIRDEYGQWRYLGSDASSRVSKDYASALSSAKQISTYTRSFAKADWDTYGANGHSESWSAPSSSGYDNTHISVGDKAYITGQVSDKAGWHAAIIGTVTSVSTTAVIMTSIKVLYNSAQTEKYVTKIDESGILISPSGNKPSVSAPQNSIKIDGNGLNVYKGGVSVASYGDYARVGKENAQRVETRSDGVYVFNNNSVQVGYYGTQFIRLGDYNGKNIRIDPSGTDAGIKFNSSTNTEVARFTDSTIELGKNSDTSSIKFCKNYASLSGSYSTSSGTNIYTVKFSNDFPLTSSNQLSEFRISAGTNATNESGILFYANNDGSKSGMHIFANDAYIDFYYRKVTMGDYLVQVEVDGEADRIRMGTHTIPRDTSTSTSTGFYLGVKANRWLQLYSWSAVNTGSDGKRKDVLGYIDFAKELIMGLEPVEFQWKDSDHIRSHMGFIAQDAAKVGKALGKDLSFYEASYIDESKGDYHGEEVSDEELSWGMMYDELIAPLVKVVQMQQKEIDQLKIELKHIEDVR